MTRPVIGRLLRSADFERVLATRSRCSSAHFAVHHLASAPGQPEPSTKSKLSTGAATAGALPVDEHGENGARAADADWPGGGVWLGTVVPKRHARRSVTRSLLKRQMRNAVASQQGLLPAGIWVLRLHAPFDRSQFTSAASAAIKQVARAELGQLLASAVAGPTRRHGRAG